MMNAEEPATDDSHSSFITRFPISDIMTSPNNIYQGTCLGDDFERE
jgi:hypothetical protein